MMKYTIENLEFELERKTNEITWLKERLSNKECMMEDVKKELALADKKEKDWYNKYFDERKRLYATNWQLKEKEYQVNSLRRDCILKDEHIFRLIQYSKHLEQINIYYKRRYGPSAVRNSIAMNNLKGNSLPSQTIPNTSTIQVKSTDGHQTTPPSSVGLVGPPQSLYISESKQSLSSRSNLNAISNNFDGTTINDPKNGAPIYPETKSVQAYDTICSPSASSINPSKSIHSQNNSKMSLNDCCTGISKPPSVNDTISHESEPIQAGAQITLSPFVFHSPQATNSSPKQPFKPIITPSPSNPSKPQLLKTTNSIQTYRSVSDNAPPLYNACPATLKAPLSYRPSLQNDQPSLLESPTSESCQSPKLFSSTESFKRSLLEPNSSPPKSRLTPSTSEVKSPEKKSVSNLETTQKPESKTQSNSKKANILSSISSLGKDKVTTKSERPISKEYLDLPFGCDTERSNDLSNGDRICLSENKKSLCSENDAYFMGSVDPSYTFEIKIKDMFDLV